ncbi:hypothetical protein OA40_04080 [Morganella morganii]|nr:hypothetical protein OA40_04080 [Morganella morganii]
MARITRPLTNNEILKAKPREKDFTLHDGDGLFLLVKTTGKKLWRFRYQRPNSDSRTNLSLGSYPALTLATARQIRDQHLTTLAQGMDPQQQQELASEQRQIELDSIFSTVAANWFQIKSKSVSIHCSCGSSGTNRTFKSRLARERSQEKHTHRLFFYI